MKRYLLTLSLVLTLLFILPIVSYDESNSANATSVIVTGQGVRLRYSPSLSSEIYCTLNKGKVLTYYKTCGDWYCVGYNGQVLYISRDFASLTNKNSSSSSSSSSKSVSYSTAVVHATNLRLRTGPGTNYPYLIWTSTGETVHVNTGDTLPYLGQTSNGFYKVSYYGVTCWIASQYATLR